MCANIIKCIVYIVAYDLVMERRRVSQVLKCQFVALFPVAFRLAGMSLQLCYECISVYYYVATVGCEQ